MDDPIIIGVSGTKQSGKSTLCSFLKDWIPKNYKATRAEVYNFADPIKKFMIDVMGLSYRQCYGTDEQKNMVTPYHWENLPMFIRLEYGKKTFEKYVVTVSQRMGAPIPANCKHEYRIPKSGNITARELMQLFGTDFIRKMFSDTIWVDTTIKLIKEQKPDVALIADTRFSSEIKTILQQPHSYIIRLLRHPFADSHSSETELDNFNFSQYGNRVFVMDNSRMSIDEQNKKSAELMVSICTECKVEPICQITEILKNIPPKLDAPLKTNILPESNNMSPKVLDNLVMDKRESVVETPQKPPIE
jgi:hypothetical protein